MQRKGEQKIIIQFRIITVMVLILMEACMNMMKKKISTCRLKFSIFQGF